VRALIALGVLVSAAASAQVPYRRTVASSASGVDLCIAWAHRDLTYNVDDQGSARTPGDTEFTALDAAWSSWQSVSDKCSDFTFTRGPRIANAPVGSGTQASNVLVFREVACRDVVPPSDTCQSDGSCANKYRCWDHFDSVIGLTTVTYSTRTGVIYDADIEFNAAPHLDGTSFLFTTISSPPCPETAPAVTCTAYDIQNTATHEIGHVLGFDHVELPSSLMAPTAPMGETSKRAIDPGTAGGFCSTYPKGQPPVGCDELAQLQRRVVAKNTGTFGCAYADSTAGLPMMALAALWLVRRRRSPARR
jgi:MYXO-CTERM domain-containing protein